MTPEIRAIADRFMYEQATLKHIAALAPAGALDRPVAGYAWTVRQLLGHLAQSLVEYGAIIRRWVAGEMPIPQGWNPDAINAETAARLEQVTLQDLFRLFGEGLNGLVAALAAIPESRIDETLGPGPLLEVLHVFEGHCLGHATALLDAVPEARMDPLVLNWLLYADFDSEEGHAWQADLTREAQAYLANLPDEGEDDEGSEEG